jgi:hypothetical protein
MSKQSLARTLALLAELKPRVDAQAKVFRALRPTEAGQTAIRRALAEHRTTTFIR